jgi:GntR family transcriptional regulator
MLDKDSPIPLYYQLVETLRERIRSGEIKPGAQLPPERDLSEQYGISRMTVRQALQYLIREDALVAKQGLGTFVAEPKLTYDPLHLLGFTEDALQRGAFATSRVIEQAIVEPPASIATRLDLRPREQATRIVRLRLSDGVPMLLETVYVPTARFEGVERADLAKHSLYQLMREHYGVRLRGALSTLEAVLANEYECELFGAPSGMLMVLLEGVTYDEDDQPVEYFKAVYRGDRFKIQLDSRKNNTQETVNASLMSVVMR